MKKKIVIIGGGLSGLSAAYSLSHLCDARVIILEQGLSYEKRISKLDSSFLIGMGGAGTLFGGKLCFPPASGALWAKTSKRNLDFHKFQDELLSKCVLSLQPHMDSMDTVDGINGFDEKKYISRLLLQDGMHGFVNSFIKATQEQNVEIRCGCTVKYFINGSSDKKVFFENENGVMEILCADIIIFATGRTSADLMYRCFPNEIQNDTPDLGIRLTLNMDQQHLFTQVGQDVKLKFQDNDYQTRTFCVCAGGSSVKVNLKGMQYYDGHFTNEITNSVNFGILARSEFHSGRNAAENYLKCMAKYLDEEISLSYFIKNYRNLSADTPYELLFANIARFAERLLDSGLIEQNEDEIPVLIPSVDHLSPQIITSPDFETRIPKVYVIGDAAGVSRGFVQAMWTGKCVADSVYEKYVCGDLSAIAQ